VSLKDCFSSQDSQDRARTPFVGFRGHTPERASDRSYTKRVRNRAPCDVQSGGDQVQVAQELLIWRFCEFFQLPFHVELRVSLQSTATKRLPTRAGTQIRSSFYEGLWRTSAQADGMLRQTFTRHKYDAKLEKFVEDTVEGQVSVRACVCMRALVLMLCVEIHLHIYIYIPSIHEHTKPTTQMEDHTLSVSLEGATRELYRMKIYSKWRGCDNYVAKKYRPHVDATRDMYFADCQMQMVAKKVLEVCAYVSICLRNIAGSSFSFSLSRSLSHIHSNTDTHTQTHPYTSIHKMYAPSYPQPQVAQDYSRVYMSHTWTLTRPLLWYGTRTNESQLTNTSVISWHTHKRVR